MIAELKRVDKSFPDADGGEPRVVLKALDLSVKESERIAIVGPSGCGKSTLLNLMGTLDTPDTGEIEVCGRQVGGLSESDLAALRAQEIGFVFQLHHLLPQATVYENVTLPSLALPEPPDPAVVRKRAEDLLEKVGLSGLRDRRPGQLSGGERQRAAVVRALINQPKLLLADEPTGALDQERAGELMELLLELNQSEGVALVMVTHDPALAGRMDRTLRFEGGSVVES